MRTFIIIFLIAVSWSFATPIDWWWSKDQQGQRLARSEQWQEAAQRFSSPMHAGSAWYRAGEFKQAAQAFASQDSAVGFFNHGNALVFGGKYEDAIVAYRKALELAPDWQEAVDNLVIAQIRAATLQKKGGEGTSGELGADDVIFDDAEPTAGGEKELTAGQQPLDEAQLQALWLKRLDAAPAVFLRNKFHSQLRQRTKEAQP